MRRDRSEGTALRRIVCRGGGALAALALLCAGLVSPPAEGAQAVRKVRFIAGAGTLDPILSNLTVGQELGFYREEGLDVDFAAAAGTGGSLGMVATGAAEFAVSTAPPLLLAAARGQDMGLITIYTWTRDIHWQVAVRPESPLRDLHDLRGKKVGVQSFGDSAYAGARGMLRELGMDPDREATFIAVGLGATAANALMTGQVDALSIWDGAFAAIENLGFKLRYLPLTPTANDLFGSGVAVRRDFLAQNRALVVGAMRAMTKGAIFVLANPEAAARIHWKLFPEARPKGKGEAEALRDTVRVITSRSGKYGLDPVKMPKYGWNSPRGWEAYVKILGLDPAKVGDLHRFYTNDLIEEANQVDVAKIRALARDYKP